KIDSDLRKFFRGQLLVALVLTVIYLIGLLIAGVPYALPVAIIGGLGNFIPYLGTFLGLFAGATASVAGHGFDIHILYVVIVFGVGQLLEGNIITPKIVGKSVGLSPVAIIFSILVFGKLLGFFGVLFAIPLASTVRVFAGELLPKLGLPAKPPDDASPPETATNSEKEDLAPDG
ncbi:MAG: AI-2E family transporter, partial [Planctomycetes bacterium]|nr:AI-2E family transporter [Planctomycetota bacterium]